MDSCIYQIINLQNNKSYVGSCKDARKRWNSHKSKLNNNIHHSIILQNAWNKYGAENFVFKIIEFCPTDKCIEREQYYIDFYSPYYNVLKNAQKGRHKLHSQETKNLISSKKIKQEVFQFALDGTFIKRWDSIADVVRFYNLKTTAHIIEACKGKRASCNKFRWSYTDKLIILKTKYKLT